MGALAWGAVEDARDAAAGALEGLSGDGWAAAAGEVLGALGALAMAAEAAYCEDTARCVELYFEGVDVGPLPPTPAPPAAAEESGAVEGAPAACAAALEACGTRVAAVAARAAGGRGGGAVAVVCAASRRRLRAAAAAAGAAAAALRAADNAARTAFGGWLRMRVADADASVRRAVEGVKAAVDAGAPPARGLTLLVSDSIPEPWGTPGLESSPLRSLPPGVARAGAGELPSGGPPLHELRGGALDTALDAVAAAAVGPPPPRGDPAAPPPPLPPVAGWSGAPPGLALGAPGLGALAVALRDACRGGGGGSGDAPRACTLEAFGLALGRLAGAGALPPTWARLLGSGDARGTLGAALSYDATRGPGGAAAAAAGASGGRHARGGGGSGGISARLIDVRSVLVGALGGLLHSMPTVDELLGMAGALAAADVRGGHRGHKLGPAELDRVSLWFEVDPVDGYGRPPPGASVDERVRRRSLAALSRHVVGASDGEREESARALRASLFGALAGGDGRLTGGDLLHALCVDVVDGARGGGGGGTGPRGGAMTREGAGDDGGPPRCVGLHKAFAVAAAAAPPPPLPAGGTGDAPGPLGVRITSTSLMGLLSREAEAGRFSRSEEHTSELQSRI